MAPKASLRRVSRLVDVMHLGRDRVIAAHLVRDLIVDPGPSSALENWVESLAEPPRAVMLTHIHLDHAGATGSLVRRFPRLQVYVHERGAAHLTDPSKLLESAGRLYGPENMERLWGEVAPVPADSIVTFSGGEEIEGFRVAYTPGHASHHVSYLDVDSGAAYVGDMAGVRVPPSEYTLMPTPPPDIDLEAWHRSLFAIEDWSPESLHLTHFGPVADVEAQLERAHRSLARVAELSHEGDRDGYMRELEDEIERDADPEAAVRLHQAAPPEYDWLGLERYWRKRRERKT
jgi:glyoxylase-like metal-dependent hydrolase (beta-lactamase superfamily II)